MTDSAIGLDGRLKDASEIEWFNDPDDEQPISVPTTQANSLHPFFATAGARRSTRVTRPSMRITDPDNIAASSTSTAQGKRKATDNPPTGHRVVPRILSPSLGSGSSDGGGSDVDLGHRVSEMDNTDHEANAGDTDDCDDDAERAYAFTKSMGDADHEVSCKFNLCIDISQYSAESYPSY
jgi:hypothetical protein